MVGNSAGRSPTLCTGDLGLRRSQTCTEHAAWGWLPQAPAGLGWRSSSWGATRPAQARGPRLTTHDRPCKRGAAVSDARCPGRQAGSDLERVVSARDERVLVPGELQPDDALTGWMSAAEHLHKAAGEADRPPRGQWWPVAQGLSTAAPPVQRGRSGNPSCALQHTQGPALDALGT